MLSLLGCLVRCRAWVSAMVLPAPTRPLGLGSLSAHRHSSISCLQRPGLTGLGPAVRRTSTRVCRMSVPMLQARPERAADAQGSADGRLAVAGSGSDRRVVRCEEARPGAAAAGGTLGTGIEIARPRAFRGGATRCCVLCGRISRGRNADSGTGREKVGLPGKPACWSGQAGDSSLHGLGCCSSPTTTATAARVERPITTMASLRGAFSGLGALRAALPSPHGRVGACAGVGGRTLSTSALLAKPFDGPSQRGRHMSAHGHTPPGGDDESLEPLQKIFSQSASRSAAAPMRVSLEKPKFGIERHGPEPLTEAEFEEAFQARPLRGYTVNFTPYTGRTVPVRYGNVQAALRQLNLILKDNNVRRQYRNQEYFEKPTTARRRIKKQRHYRKFAQAVREKVQLVRPLRPPLPPCPQKTFPRPPAHKHKPC